MSDTFRGTAISLTEQRTDHMILILSIGIVFTLAVGGFVMAGTTLGDQNTSSIDDPQEMVVMDSFDPAENAQLQALRELSFVMESESGCWGPMGTEQGYIMEDTMNIPALLPLCLNNDTMTGWYIDFLIYGGYTPWDGSIAVFQKDDFKGCVKIAWTLMFEGDCGLDTWRATFYVYRNISLDSYQYPDVTPFCLDVPGGQQTIPGKDVYFGFTTDWTGCVPGNNQDFTIIHSHSSLSSRNLNSQTSRLESESKSNTSVE
jgi:hypothetical protein